MNYKYIIILLILSSCISKEKISIDENKKLHPFELDIKVYEDTEKEYLNFVESQSRIREKIDSNISPEDLMLIEELNEAYENYLEKQYKNNTKALEMNNMPMPKYEMAKKLFTLMNNRWMNKVRCITDVMTPLMLENKNLEQKAIYLSNKYRKEIEQILPEINEEYRKLKTAERKAYLKHSNSDNKNIEPRNTKSKSSKSNLNEELSRIQIWNYVKTLMIK